MAINLPPLRDALGRPLRDLRLSVTDRCNLNCTYCMPDKDMQFLPREEILSFEEIARMVRIFKTLGVRKVKITGGEPTLRIGVHNLIKCIVDTGVEDVGLITNGMFLKALSNRLYDAGLRRITVSLDSIHDTVFRAIVGNTHSVHPVLEGITTAQKAGFQNIKINCVIQKNINDQSIMPMVKYCRENKFVLRFIEFMDVGDIDWDEQTVVRSQHIVDTIDRRYRLTPLVPAYSGEVAARYKYQDGNGEIGFISSVSNPFCSDCTRVRLTADGILYGCLFSSEGEGVGVKPALRSGKSDEYIAGVITDFWHARSDRYSEIRASSVRRKKNTARKKAMNVLGG